MVSKAGIKFAMTVEDVKNIQELVENKLKTEAIRQGIVADENELIIRDIIPNEDLGLDYNVWSFSTSNHAYNTYVSTVLPEKKTIIFFGVKNKSVTPLTTALRFKLGAAKIKDIIQLEEAWVKEEPVAYFNSPILYKNKQTIVIEGYGDGSGTDKLILLGKVAEPKGEQIVGGE